MAAQSLTADVRRNTWQGYCVPETSHMGRYGTTPWLMYLIRKSQIAVIVSSRRAFNRASNEGPIHPIGSFRIHPHIRVRNT